MKNTKCRRNATPLGRERTVRAAAVLGVVSMVLAGCGSERSPEAFCGTMDKHKERYLAAMDSATESLESGTAGGALAGLGGGLAAISDLQAMWEELADVAPEDIRVDVELIRDENQKQLDAAGENLDNPLGALGSAMMSGFKTYGAYQRVDEFTGTHCD